jgi:hypothetical protein
MRTGPGEKGRFEREDAVDDVGCNLDGLYIQHLRRRVHWLYTIGCSHQMPPLRMSVDGRHQGREIQLEQVSSSWGLAYGGTYPEKPLDTPGYPSPGIRDGECKSIRSSPTLGLSQYGNLHDDPCSIRHLPRPCSFRPPSVTGPPEMRLIVAAACLSVSATRTTADVRHFTYRTPFTTTLMDTFEQLPYNGISTKLCLAFDIGTSFSSISYCILNPGQVPVIRNVNRCEPSKTVHPICDSDRPFSRFPRQHHADRIEKVPSVIYYDQDGQLRAIGAEILDPDTNAEAADEGWIKVAWRVCNPARPFRISIHSLRIDRFKLLFGPKRGAKPGLHCPLPPNKTKEDVLSDYLRYLYDCSREFIEDTHPDGVFLWKSLHGDAQFILSHPTTWGRETTRCTARVYGSKRVTPRSPFE